MRRLGILLAMIVGMGWMAAAQSTYVIVDSVRLPTESYVGDPVELRYTVRTQAIPVVPEDIAQPSWGEVSALRITQRTGEFDMRMTAIPYEPGTLTLPRIDLGAVRIEGLSLIVESVLVPGEATLRSAHGPRRLPGTRAALLLVALGFSLVIAFVFYGMGPGRAHLRSLIRGHRARIPYRNLLACVQMLQRDIQKYSMRDFYIVLIKELQAFMTSRMREDCMAATSTELIGLLPRLEKSCGAVPGTAAPLEEILQAADGAKFAHGTIRRKKRSRHLMVVHAVAVELESHRKTIGRGLRREQERKSHVGA